MAEGQPDLNVEIGLSINKFMQRLAAIEAQAVRKANTIEREWERAMGSMGTTIEQRMKRGEQAVATFTRELDRLEDKFNPAAAASRRFQAEVDDLNMALKRGVVDQQLYSDTLARLRAENAARQLGNFHGQVQAVSHTMRRSSFGDMRMMSMQLSQVAQQGAITGDYFRALAWQLPDLALGFGTVGIAVGAVAGVLGTLALDMLDAGEEAEDFEAILGRVDDALGSLDQAIDKLSLKGIVDEFGRVNEELMALNVRRAMADLRTLADETAAILGAVSASDVISAVPSELQTALTAEIRLIIAEQSVAEIQQEIAGIQARIETGVEISPDELKRLTDLTVALDTIQASDDVAVTVTANVDAVIEAERLLRDLPKELEGKLSIEGLESLVRDIEAARAALQAVGAEADRGLLTKLDDVQARLQVAVNRMTDLESATARAGERASDAEKAAVELAKEIGQAAVDALRLAGVDMASGISAAQKEAAILAANLEAALGAAVSLDQAEALNTQLGGRRPPSRPVDWVAGESNERTDRPTRARSGGGGGGAREKPFFEDVERQIRNLERQMELIGQTTREVAMLTAKWELLDEAKRRNLDLDKAYGASSETLRAQIDRQANAIGDLTAAAEEYANRLQFVEGLQQQFLDGLIDAAIEGKSLSGVMSQLALDIGRAYLQAALFNQGPFGKSSFGKGILGGLLGFSTGGFTGAGGRNEPAGIVHKGEYVFDQTATRRLGVANLEALSRGMSLPVSDRVGAAAAQSISLAAPQVNVRAIIVDSAKDIGRAWARSPEGEQEILAIVNRAR